MAIDTEREKQIGLGPKWPFDPLEEGKCLASSTFSSNYNVNKNEKLYFHVNLGRLLKTIVTRYNVLAKEKGWEQAFTGTGLYG